MGWRAYAVKDGVVPPESPSLASSTYASLLGILSPWRNWWWQNPEPNKPEVDEREVLDLLKKFAELQESLKEHYPDYTAHLLVFLRYCADNHLGFIVSI